MCKTGSTGWQIGNVLTNPLANLYKEKKDPVPVAAAPAPATVDTAEADRVKEETKQKQLDAQRRSRRTTILTNLGSSSGGGKTLLGQ